ncbi:MAG: DUF4340 domain-containing protein [Myxococcota bacterium]
MSRINQILIVLLAVQTLGFVVGRSFSSDPTEQSTAVFFADLDADKVTAIEILGPPAVKKDDPPQNKVTVQKTDGKWGIADADAYPVDDSKVTELVETLKKLRSRNRVLQSSVYHEKLEVSADKYQRKLTVTAGDQKTVLYVGTSPRFKNVHVRLDGSDEVFLLNDFGTTQLGDRAWNWVDRDYVKYPSEQVWQVTVKNSKGEVQLQKDPVSSEWGVLGLDKALDKSTVDDFVRKASNVNLESPVGKTVSAEFGLGADAAMVTLVTGTSTATGLPPPTTKTVSWQIGKKLEAANQHYVKANDNAYVVKVAAFGLTPLLEKTTEDFAAKAPEEEK